MYTLPSQGTPTLGDLNAGYIIRGAQIFGCAVMKDLAVETHDKEHADELAWKTARVKRNCPWWKFGFCRVTQD